MYCYLGLEGYLEEEYVNIGRKLYRVRKGVAYEVLWGTLLITK